MGESKLESARAEQRELRLATPAPAQATPPPHRLHFLFQCSGTILGWAGLDWAGLAPHQSWDSLFPEPNSMFPAAAAGAGRLTGGLGRGLVLTAEWVRLGFISQMTAKFPLSFSINK